MTSAGINDQRVLTILEPSEFREKSQWLEYIENKTQESFKYFIENLSLHPDFDSSREELSDEGILYDRWRGSRLDLKGKNLTNANISDLSEALKESPKVASLDLSCNEINDEGAEILASALRVSSFISVNDLFKNPALNLDQNALSFSGVQSILNALYESHRPEVEVYFGQQEGMPPEDYIRIQKHSLALTFRMEMEKNGEDLDSFKARVEEELGSGNTMVLYPLMLEVLQEEFGVMLSEENK